MGLTELVQQDLIRLVKFCILDGAIINGKPIDECIGTVKESVTYNDISTVVETTIDESDISRYFSEKSDNRHSFTLA